MKFLKATLIGGLIFLIPVVVLIFIFAQAIDVMLIVADPLADVIPVDSIGGIATANIIALLAILVICLLAGLAARTGPVQRLAERIEHGLLGKLPGYAMIKGLASSFDKSRAAELKPVLVNFSELARVGLEVERIGDDRLAVYLPDAPNAWSGIVGIVSADLVEQLDAPVSAVLSHAELMGKDSEKLLSGS